MPVNRHARLLENIGLSANRLDSPQMQQEQQQQDMDPQNFGMIDKELGRKNLNTTQRDTLMNERQRLEKMQLQQLTQASQQFAPKLAQSLDVEQHTQMPLDGPAQNLVKLILMMRRRAGFPTNPQMRGTEMAGAENGY